MRALGRIVACLALLLGALPAWAAAGAECPTAAADALQPLPVLASDAQGVLALSIVASRARAPVAIGDLLVRDVPVFTVRPEGGTTLQEEDGTPLPLACLDTPTQLYAGTLWTLRQGDVLRVRLASGLDFTGGELPRPPAGGMSCRGINLHTHGLLVSPARQSGKDGEQGYGDSAYDYAVPTSDGPSGDDPCGAGMAHDGGAMQPGMLHHAVAGPLAYRSAIPGSPGESGRGDGEHPYGLFWFHPHVHGYGSPLGAGGTSGVITIGGLGDYLCVQAGAACTPPTALRVRTLVLRDAEVVRDGEGWRLAHERLYAMEDACAFATGRDADREGQCEDRKDRRWLFTINGQRFPRIDDADPARAEVWRIVNASPNMSYRLRLRAAGDDAAALPLTVLSLEGAAPAPAALTPPGHVDELLLMPASRAEIAIPLPPVAGDYVLEQQRFTTGGDAWPRILLARVHLPARGPDDPAGHLRLRAAAPEPAAAPRFVAASAEPACDYPPDAIRRVLLVERPSFTDDRRRPIKFGLLAALDRPGGTPIAFDGAGRPTPLTRDRWAELLKQDADAPAFAHNPLGAICTYLGHSETWIVENWTDEAHNFHVHQSEFRLAEAHRGDPAFFSEVPRNPLGDLQKVSDGAVATADGAGREGLEASLYHDTIPVPRGVALGGRGCDGSPFNDRCRPGRIAIVIRFDRDAQVGTFVYHCHILQHEDGGMMAAIRVLCPPGDTACAARHPEMSGRAAPLG